MRQNRTIRTECCYKRLKDKEELRDMVVFMQVLEEHSAQSQIEIYSVKMTIEYKHRAQFQNEMVSM
jgi:hypothetical protein